MCGIAAGRSSPRSPTRSPRNSGRERTTRVRLRGRLDPAHGRRAVHPHGVRSCSCCWATSAGPAAASWRCAGTPASRAPPTSRRCSTCCPATCRCRTRTQHDDLDAYVAADGGTNGLLGQHARLHRQPAQGLVGRRGHGRQRLLLRLPAAADRRPRHLRHRAGPDRRRVQGLLPDRARTRRSARPTPGCSGSGMANLDWLVVRDFSADRERHLLEGRPGDRDRASCAPRTSAPRCSSSPPPRTPRRTAPSPTPSGCCSGTTRRSSRRATRAATCGSSTTSAGSSGRSWRARPTERDRPILDLTWDYPIDGQLDEPDAEAVLARDQRLRRRTAAAVRATPSSRTTARPRCGCWIYCGVYADGVNQAARRKPGQRADLGGAGVGLGLAGEPAHPLQPRLRRPGRAGRGASARPTSGGTPSRSSGPATTSRTSSRQAAATTCPPEDATARGRARPAPTRSSCRPTARAGCSRPPGWPTGRCRRTTSRRSRRSPTRSTASRPTRPGRSTRARDNRYHPTGGEPGAEVFPYVVTTYRLTEHHTAGGMSRWPALPRPSCSRSCSARCRPSSPPSAAWSTSAGRRSSPRGRRSRRGCWSPSG